MLKKVAPSIITLRVFSVFFKKCGYNKEQKYLSKLLTNNVYFIHEVGREISDSVSQVELVCLLSSLWEEAGCEELIEGRTGCLMESRVMEAGNCLEAAEGR